MTSECLQKLLDHKMDHYLKMFSDGTDGQAQDQLLNNLMIWLLSIDMPKNQMMN